MTSPGRGRLIAGVCLAVAVIATAAAILLIRVGPWSDPDDPGVLNGLRLEIAPCPANLVVQPGTDLYRDCTGSASDRDLRVTVAGVAVSPGVSGELAIEDLPAGPIGLRVDGVAAGTVDVLSCRSYAQSTGTDGVIASLVPEIAYGIEPMTAAIIAQPYTLQGWPDNQWRATAANPTEDQLADRPDLFDTLFRCTWFLLPPGSIADRPGVIRSYTSTDTTGEPAIHVLDPGSGADSSQSISDSPTTAPIPTFAFRSLGDGTTVTTGDSWIDHYLLPTGSWTVTDRTTGRQATVDIGPGQTVRVVSVVAITAPGTGSPVATPIP